MCIEWYRAMSFLETKAMVLCQLGCHLLVAVKFNPAPCFIVAAQQFEEITCLGVFSI